MIVEHQFVTTLPEFEAREAAREVMIRSGFQFLADNDAWLSLHRPQKSKAPVTEAEVLITLKAEFDRQRISLVLISSERHRSFALGGAKKLTADYLTRMATVIEASACSSPNLQSVVAAWETEEKRLVALARTRRIRRWVVVVAIILSVIAFCVIVAYSQR